nr:cytidine deaminase [bacterium]
MPFDQPTALELLSLASETRKHAYSSYSGYAVGAALLTTAGAKYRGCNVENISYGLTVCAERNAIAAAVAGGLRPYGLTAMAIVAGSSETGAIYFAEAPLPCGACLQVIAEFASAEMHVI